MRQESDLAYGVPAGVWLAVALFLFVQAVVIGQLRGIGDREGYPLNTSRVFALNNYEDDGSANLALALGHTESLPRYLPYAIDTGGPYLHLGRLVLKAADRLGLVAVFQDPSLYLLYPDAYRGVWKAFAVYKAVLLVLAPLALYWLCANHVSRPSGVLAAWMFVVMPFVPGFETRLKVDALAVAVGLLSVLHQVQYLRRRRPRHLVYAAAWLGLSLSMKFVMAPAALTLAGVHAFCSLRGSDPVRHPWRLALLAGTVLGAVYVLANPLVLPGSLVYFSAISKHLGENAVLPASAWAALWRRWSTLDVFLGPVLPWCVPFALALCLWLAARLREQRPFLLLLLALLGLQTLYFSLSFRGALGGVTYYYYSHAILLIPLLAASLAWCRDAWARRFPGAAFLATAGIALALALAARSQADVVRYLTSPTDRQRALAWLDRNVPPDASVGVPVAAGASVIDSLVRVDPFAHQVVPVGRDGAQTDLRRPDYVLWMRPAPDAPALGAREYSLAARFDAGAGLPHDRYDLFQEEVFEVYARDARTGEAASGTTPWDLEYAIGQFMRQDPEQRFNILQFQATHFYPISLNLFRKAGGTVLPFSTQAFTETIRHRASPLAYVHQADPLCATLWGVKYVVADIRPDAAFVTQTLAADRAPYVLKRRLSAPFDGSPREIGIFANAAYLGQAFFAADPGPGEAVVQRRVQGRWLRRPLQTYGVLYPGVLRAAGPEDALEVHLVLETDTAADILVKAAGRRQSYLVGPGYHDLRLPFTPGPDPGDIGYEINPVSGAGRIVIHGLAAAPLRLQGAPRIAYASVDTEQAFARVAGDTPGRVLFALPGQARWRAEVDGRPVTPVPGPAGCVAIPVAAGEHFVALRTDF